MLLYLFRSIDTVFRPKNATYSFRKEPISTNNICLGGSNWLTNNTVLGWELDTKEHHLRLTPNQENKVRSALETIPAAAHQVSFPKWRNLFGLLRSITPAVSGSHAVSGTGMAGPDHTCIPRRAE